MQYSPLTKTNFHTQVWACRKLRFICVSKFLPQNAKPGKKNPPFWRNSEQNWNCDYPYFFLSGMSAVWRKNSNFLPRQHFGAAL